MNEIVEDEARRDGEMLEYYLAASDRAYKRLVAQVWREV
jgi:hypothetical protein